MNVFYASPPENNILVLDEQESRHCVKVLRMKQGDELRVIDGAGGFYHAVIEDADPRECRLSVLTMERNYGKLPYDLHIGIAPTKSIDRFEFFLEKATEIGVSSITPLICERSERKAIRLDRLEKVIISAMKQSLKAYKPSLNEMRDLKEWLASSNSENRLIAHCIDKRKHELWKMDLTNNITLAIGPEGDFSPAEINLALESGFTEISLGENRLRTETAGIFACSAVYYSKH